MPHHTRLKTSAGTVDFDRTRIMGILNVTPDSFSDGGHFNTVEKAFARGLEMVEQGAAILDVGGESTRPGADSLPVDEELARVIPVIERLARSAGVPVSIDTYKLPVAQAAVDAGAAIVNDVTALRGDEGMARFVGAERLPVILMHALWPPQVMQDNPEYVNVVEDVVDFLDRQTCTAMASGVPRDRILIDPGIGFGKTLDQNLDLLRSLPRFVAEGFPVVVGPSRKRFIGELTSQPVSARTFGTAGAVAVCAAAGVNLVRVHDVAAIRDVVRVVDAIVWQV
jgi:dihydropteroate synthase